MKGWMEGKKEKKEKKEWKRLFIRSATRKRYHEHPDVGLRRTKQDKWKIRRRRRRRRKKRTTTYAWTFCTVSLEFSVILRMSAFVCFAFAAWLFLASARLSLYRSCASSNFVCAFGIDFKTIVSSCRDKCWNWSISLEEKEKEKKNQKRNEFGKVGFHQLHGAV